MAELFRQLAFINAILGGFAITFLSVLITASVEHRILDWILGVLLAASSCFVLSALGSTFSAAVATNYDSLPEEVAALHEPLSLLFLAGTIFLFATLGMTGWIRSRKLGVTTSVLATIALIGGFFVLRPFINFN